MSKDEAATFCHKDRDNLEAAALVTATKTPSVRYKSPSKHNKINMSATNSDITVPFVIRSRGADSAPASPEPQDLSGMIKVEVREGNFEVNTNSSNAFACRT